MHSDETILKHGSRAFQLVKQLKKKATICLESDSPERQKAMSQLEDLEKLFEPFEVELQRLKEEREQHELEIKRVCAEKGHTGEWAEETYFVEGWMGDLSDRQWVKQPRIRWVRTCTRCGKQEVSEVEPKEVKECRKRKEIEELENKIKELKAEL